MAGRVEVKVIAAELGHVHESVDIQSIERHENAEARDAGDRAGELFPDPVLHVVTFEPLQHIARCIIGAPLGHRAVQAQRIP